MKKTAAKAIATAVLAMSLAACEGTLPGTKPEAVQADIMGTSHSAAEALIESAAAGLDPDKPLIAATFVNIDDLSKASSFGRIVSEQVASRFTQKGIKVVEILLRNSVYIKQKGGEFLLSRELRSISSQHNAQAVIVGTYAVGRKNVYVTTRLINASDNIIMASHDYSLPLDQDVAFMLRER